MKTINAPMKNFADRPLARVRVGVAGMGFRGTDAVSCISRLPNTEVAAMCDVFEERLKINNRYLVEEAKLAPGDLLAVLSPVHDLNADEMEKVTASKVRES